MAAQKGDVTIVRGAIGDVTRFPVDDRTTSSQTETIKPGNPVTQDNANFVEIVANGGPVNSTGLFVGIAHNESDETSSADGEVDVEVVVPFVTIMRARATTAANIDTAAKLLGIKFDAVAFDNTSNVITIDEDEGDDPNEHGLVIVGGDINKGTLDFYVKPLASVFGNNV
jgi:hypothetical protein